jgi:hypothetical protein
MQSLIVKAFEEARLGDIIGLMQLHFGPEKYTIWQLFQDEKRKVFDLITYQSMRDLENSLRRIYNRDYPLVMALANNDAPIPNAYRTTFEYILNADLIRCFLSERINIRQIERITMELVKWRLNIEDIDRLERMVGESIIRELRRFSQEQENYTRIERLNRLFPLLSKLNLSPNLYKSQNLYFELAKANAVHDRHSPEWKKEFVLLGENLRVKIDEPLD